MRSAAGQSSVSVISESWADVYRKDTLASLVHSKVYCSLVDIIVTHIGPVFICLLVHFNIIMCCFRITAEAQEPKK